MMMTEMKWPGWPELPFLLLFAGIAVLVTFLFLEAPGSGADGESGVVPPEIVPEKSESR